MKHFSFKLGFVLVLLGLSTSVSAQTDHGQYFDTAWRLVKERYWNEEKITEIWDGVRQKYETQALATTDDEAFYNILEEMYQEIGDNHSIFVPPSKVEEIRKLYGDLPCFGVFSQSNLVASERNFNFTTLGNINYDVLEEDIGYIKLPDLATAFTPANVRSAVQNLEDQGVSSLILDLRGNPGGRLIEMMQVAGIFSSGFLWRILTRWTLPLPYPAVGSVETELPLAVLIDGGVNSAAEGLAGALQTSGRATLFGETTAGNVEAVLPFCLRDGSQAWIATGILAPLRGATWEGRGVVPDVKVAAEEALEAAVSHLILPQN